MTEYLNGLIETSSGNLVMAGCCDFSSLEDGNVTAVKGVPCPPYVSGKIYLDKYHQYDSGNGVWVLRYSSNSEIVSH